MTISEMILPEFDQEMANTRRMLAGVPQDKYSWKPHEKSMSMVHLASHVAELPRWATETLRRTMLEIGPEERPFLAQSNAEMMARFDENVKEARALIEASKDEDYSVPWSLVFGGHTAFTMPRFMVLRTVVLNHLIHHRAQLGTYLRENEIPVPGMYGPSADDMAKAQGA